MHRDDRQRALAQLAVESVLDGMQPEQTRSPAPELVAQVDPGFYLVDAGPIDPLRGSGRHRCTLRVSASPDGVVAEVRRLS